MKLKMKNKTKPTKVGMPTKNNIESVKSSQISDSSRKIIFKHSRAIGDALMFSAGIRDFKLLFPDIRINVDSNFPAVWENNPYIDRTIKKDDPGVEFYKVGYPIINNCNNSYMHFTAGFLYNMVAVVDAHERLPMSVGEFTAVFSGGEVGDYDLGVSDSNMIPIPCGVWKPGDKEISCSCEMELLVEEYSKDGKIAVCPKVFYRKNGELNRLATLKQKYGVRKPSGGLNWLPEGLQNVFGKNDKFCTVFGRQRADIHLTKEEKSYSLIKDLYGEDIKYWVVAPGGKSDCTCKIWDWRKFQDVIDYFDGMIKFVTIGRSDHIMEKFKGVIDLTDKFNSDVRGLIPLVYHSEGCVSGVTFLMHLAAAVPPRFKSERKPCVAIYGGREPTAFTAYCNHQVLHTNGSFECCDNGGCWQSRVTALQTNPSRNKRFCKLPIEVEGKTIQACMNSITAQDVIRGIEKYYDGNIYTYINPVTSKKKKVKLVEDKKILKTAEKEINVLASLSSRGGGEQSACMIVKLLRKAGWKVNFHPWANVHKNYSDQDVSKYSFREQVESGAAGDKLLSKGGMYSHMVEGVPLLFYANDQIGSFCREAESIVEKSSAVIVGINYINSDLPKCRWLDKTGKLKAVIFQCQEKKNEFEEKMLGFSNTKLITLFGAINLDSLYEVCTKKRENKDEPFRVLRHGLPDGRKYVTEATKKGGDKKHLWQHKFDKETSVRFYQRLLKDTPKNVIFEFMEAHSELVNAFPNEPRMIFRKFNSMPVEEFLSRGHCYLMRSSNHWRDNFPRVHAEAMSAGLVSIVEPRDGTAQRIKDNVGDIGFFACHYDEFLLHLRTLNRKMDLQYEMGNQAKQWAKTNLDPVKWVEVIEDICIQ